MVRSLLLISAVCCMTGAGCTYVGTRHVDQDMIKRLGEASTRLESGMPRDEAMNLFPAGEKQEWGRGVGVDDETVKYEEWRIYAEDQYGRPSPRWDRPPVAEEFIVFQRWLYFVDGQLYAVTVERDSLEDQEGVRPTWAKGGRFDPVGTTVSTAPPRQSPGETTNEPNDGADR